MDLKVVNERLEKIEGQLVPDIFDELGFKSIQLADGTRVEVEDVITATITEANKTEALQWLRDHGHEGLLKHDVVVSLKKGDKEGVYNTLIEALRRLKVRFKDNESVQWQTLRAFVKEQLEGKDAVTFPKKLFSVFTMRRTKTS